jgi:UDP-2,3-diacylglucosamine pyrophosphatase LpxH
MQQEKSIINTLFLSDCHLGYKYSRADRVAKVLRSYRCNYLILIGDFIEGFGFPNKFNLTKDVLDVFGEMLRMKDEGTTIILLGGNHDAFLRSAKFSFPGIEIVPDSMIYITAKYEQVLLFHGDIFDTFLEMKLSPAVYRIGDFMYTVAIFLNNKINLFRKLFGFRKYWSLSKFLKQSVKGAINYLNQFEIVVCDYTLSKNVQVCICGHVHIPADKEIQSKYGTIRYMNTGSFINGEGYSWIIEDLEGNLILFHKDENNG